jgi:hypothetical protein
MPAVSESLTVHHPKHEAGPDIKETRASLPQNQRHSALMGQNDNIADLEMGPNMGGKRDEELSS